MGKKIVLVTGANKGIGFGIAKHLGLSGWKVVIGARNQQRAEKATEELESLGIDVLGWVNIELADLASIEKAAKEVNERFPELSLLVNNAGIRRDTLAVFMSDEDWHDVMNTNLNGAFYLIRRLVKNMMTHRAGRIINIASVSGLKGQPGQLNYSAAKAAMIGATKSLAQEVGSRKITVNAVAPGFIATDMTEGLDEANLKKLIPAGRFGKPEEVAAVVGFLASDDAAYINGEVISVNGGLYS